MKQFFLIIACICCWACSNNEAEVCNQSRKEVIEETEHQLQLATQGIPLSIPIVNESDPSVWVVPVSDSKPLRIDRVFVLDGRARKVNYKTDIYELDSIVQYSGSRCDLIVRTLQGQATCLLLDDPLIISGIIFDVKEINYSKNKMITHRIPVVEKPDEL